MVFAATVFSNDMRLKAVGEGFINDMRLKAVGEGFINDMRLKAVGEGFIPSLRPRPKSASETGGPGGDEPRPYGVQKRDESVVIPASNPGAARAPGPKPQATKNAPLVRAGRIVRS